MPRWPWNHRPTSGGSADPAVTAALDALLNAETWGATRAVLEAQADVLLSEAALAALRERIAARRAPSRHGNPTAPDAPGPSAELLEQHLRLLEDARRDGLPAAWARLQADLQREQAAQIAELERDPQARAALAAMAAQLARDPRALATLLGMDADDPRLAELAAQLGQPQANQSDPNSVNVPESLFPLVDEAQRLTQPQDMPRKIALFREAIRRVEAGEGDRILWAALQNDLAIALRNDPLGDRAANLEAAISAYQAALQVRTRAAFPVQWATTQNNLGTAYSDRILGEKAANLEAAISAYQDALQVYTRAAFPVQWATTQNNLGTALRERILGEKAANLEAAIGAYQAALQVYTRAAFPINFRDTTFNLALACEDAGRWRDADAAYTAAREAQRDLIALAADEGGRLAVISQMTDKQIGVRAALVALHVPEAGVNAAAAILEEERARGMRDSMAMDALDPATITDPAARARAKAFQDARAAWRMAQATMGGPLPLDPRQALDVQRQRRAALHAAYDAFTQARDAIRAHDNPDFLSPVARLSDIAAALTTPAGDPDEALVYLAAGFRTGLALIITRGRDGAAQVHHLPLPDLTAERTDGVLQTEDDLHGRQVVSGGFAQAQMHWAFGNLQDWGATAAEALAALPAASGFAQALRAVQARWQDAGSDATALFATPFVDLTDAVRATLDDVFTGVLLRLELDRALPALGSLGVGALARWLRSRGIQRVALVPYGRLALFPLPAVPVTCDSVTRPLGEWCAVALTPSAGTLAKARQRAALADAARQAGTRRAVEFVGNPYPLAWEGGNLAYAQSEADSGQKIARLHGIAEGDIVKLTLREAKRAHVLRDLGRVWYAHFALHGQYNAASPRQSRIILAGLADEPAGQRTITLDECLTGKVDLTGLRLLVLSACETSIINIRQAAEETLGMAAGFLQAGAACVIATLWPVNDHASYLLMARFINLWLDPRRAWSPARCLAEAQRWLREDVTNAYLLSWQPDAPIPLDATPAVPAPDFTAPTLPRALAAAPEPERELALARRRSLRYNQAGALAQIRAAASHRDPNDHPYAHPDYWAAFAVSGAGL